MDWRNEKSIPRTFAFCWMPLFSGKKRGGLREGPLSPLRETSEKRTVSQRGGLFPGGGKGHRTAAPGALQAQRAYKPPP